MPQYNSTDKRTQTIGITGYTEASTVLEVIGNTTFDGNVDLGDDDRLRLGDGADLQIYHDSTFNNGIIKESGSGNLLFGGDNILFRDAALSELHARFITNGSAELYYDNIKRLETTATGATITGTLIADGISLGDNDEIRLGDGNGDLGIWHNGSNSIINDEGVGDLYLGGNSSVNITNSGLNEFKAKFITDGAVELYYDNVKKFETTSTGATLTGVLVADGVDLGDDDRLRFGDSQDLQIYHDGSNSFINDSGVGDLYIRGSSIVHLQTAGGEDGVKVITDGAVELYYDNTKRLETTATGATTTGTLLADSLSTGAAGTGINISTNTITGPSTLTIDPAAIGDNTGTVVIAGDLQIDGTTTTVNSTTMTVDDKNLELGTGAANDAAADGGGITIVSGDGNKTFQFEATGDNLGSSENLNLANTKEYKINNTSVLSATTLGSGVTASSLTSVGILNGLTVDGDLLISDRIGHLNDSNTAIRFPATDTIRFATSGSSRLDVTPNGYILLGTTIEPSGGDVHAQNAKLLIQGRVGNTADSGRLNLQRGSSASDNSSIGSISFTDNGNNAFSRIETFADATPGSTSFPGRIVFSTTNDGASTPTEKLRITSDGVLLVGTNSTSNTLASAIIEGNPTNNVGNIAVTYSGSTPAVGDQLGNVAFGDSGHVQSAFIGAARDGGTWTSGSSQPTKLQFTTTPDGSAQTGGFLRMTIKGDGNIGIGTSNPTELLNLAADSAHRILLKRTGTTPSEVSFGNEGNYAVISNNTNGIDLRTGSTPSSSMHIDQNGLVGIGTENPATILEIAGTGSPTIRVTDLDGTDQFGQIIANNGTFVVESRDDTSTGRIMFRGRDGSGTVEYGRFDSNGDLGIGIADPQERLHVSSVILVTGETPQIRLNSSATDASDNDRSILGQATAANNFVNTAATGDTVLRGTSTDNLLFGIGTSEKVRITSSGFVGINETNPLTGLTINEWGTQPVPNSNTYPYPAGNWVTNWVTQTNNSNDYWAGFGGGGYLRSSATVNIALAPNHADISDQAGMYIAGEATSTTTSVFTIGKIVGGSATGSSSSPGTQRATKDELFRITNIGNVGINTTAPREKLDISAGRIILDQDYQFTWADGTTNRVRIYGDSGDNFIVENGSSNTERLRIGSAGQIGLSGANYGSSGQVLTSNGATSAPTWQDVSSINLANETTDTETFLTFALAATGQQALKTNDNLTFNSSTGALSASTLVSTVATGTAPLTVTSTTLVTNLNADLLDGQEGSFYTNASNINAGTLAIAYGGTNSSATPTAGGAAYGTGTAYAFTAAGTSGQVLTSNGAAAPTWQDVAVAATDESTDTTCFPLFATAATGAVTLKTDASGLTYDSANERLQSTDVTVKGAVRCENSASTERFEILYNETTDSLDFSYFAS